MGILNSSTCGSILYVGVELQLHFARNRQIIRGHKNVDGKYQFVYDTLSGTEVGFEY